MNNKESSYLRENLGFQLELFSEFNWLSKLVLLQSSLTVEDLMARLRKDTGKESSIFSTSKATFTGELGQHSFRLRRIPSRQSPWIEGRVIPEASGCRVELHVGWPWWIFLLMLLSPLSVGVFTYYGSSFGEFDLPILGVIVLLQAINLWLVKRRIASTLELMEQYF